MGPVQPDNPISLPPFVFVTNGSMKAGTEQIDYGYLTLAHTNGDIYVFFKNSNRKNNPAAHRSDGPPG